MRTTLLRLGAVSLALQLAAACTTADKKAPSGGELGGGKGSGKDKDKGEASGGATASANRVTFTNSLANNTLTSQTISNSKAEAEVQKFAGGNAKDIRALEGRISAERLARKGAGEVLATAKRLAELEMEKGGAGKTAPDAVKLEVALAALQSRNFSLAEYFLQELTEAKEAKIKAGAFNALGVIALRDDRVPEAVLYFKEALKAVSNYKPAQLNLGFAALKGGDIATAKSMLGGMQNDWFVQYGLISVNRIDGGNAGELCDRVLKVEPGHIGALFNCGLFEYQNKHNVAKAKEYLTRAGKAKGGENGWGERAFALIAQIDQEEAQAKQSEAKKKAEAAAAAKAKAAPTKPQGGAAAGGGAPAGAPAGGAPATNQKPGQ